MINIYDLDFTNKTILEVGTGRGGTTLELAKVMKNFKGVKLITTDIHDGCFEKLKGELFPYNLDVNFIKTNACDLNEIEDNSIDLIVCNYTLCAINTKSGSETIALNRFREVLKLNGMLYMEEEYPINIASNHMQQIWSRKWQLLRATNMLLGELSFNEIEPETLKKLLNIIGFKNVEWENDEAQITGENCLEFFNYRFNKGLNRLKSDTLIQGLKKEGEALAGYAKEAGGMEIPIYKIIAIK